MECKRLLGSYFRAIANALGQTMQHNLDELGLTATQNMFLHHLWMRQEKLGLPTSPKDLEDFFDIKHPTVSGILQRMEAAGFVTFRPSQIDRRCKMICLTDQALEVVSAGIAHIESTEATLTRGMTESEVLELRRLLQIAANNLGVCMQCPPKPSEKEEFHP